MKDFPIVAKLILNIILFVVYWVLFSLILGVLYGFGGQIFGYEVAPKGDSVYNKFALILLLLIFVLTIVFRKYFYVGFGANEEKINKNEKKDNFDTTI